jgi:hypothetical protein
MSKAEKVCATLSEVLEQVRTITETLPHHPVQARAPEVASAGHLQ